MVESVFSLILHVMLDQHALVASMCQWGALGQISNFDFTQMFAVSKPENQQYGIKCAQVKVNKRWYLYDPIILTKILMPCITSVRSIGLPSATSGLAHPEGVACCCP